jgi:hypothetical protein
MGIASVQPDPETEHCWFEYFAAYLATAAAGATPIA